MIDILIFSILILLSALFSSAETAFFSLTPAKVRLMVQKDKFATDIIDKLKHRPRRLLITILIGNNIVNLFTASYATIVAGRYFDSAALGIATGLTTIFILIFGEIIPKSFAIAKNERIAQITAWPIYVMYIIFIPVVFLLHRMSKYLHKAVGVDSAAEIVSEEEIRTLSRIGVEHGIIDKSEHEMLENVFQFDNIAVSDVMMPFEKIIALSGTVPVEQIAYQVSQIGHSRYPVYEGDNEDKMIGYIHTNTIMKVLNSDDRDRPIGEFVSDVQYVKSDEKIEKIFRKMNKKHSHMFLVKNAKTSELVGLVTLEDILEELVGEIIDETDVIDSENK